MLSVIIITKNEAHNIERCLQSVSWASQIVVIDSGSEDNTIALAKKYTPNVFIMADWQGYGIQKQRALEKTNQPWVLNLDADEFVTEDLKQEILTTIKNPNIDGARIPICMYFYDKALPHSSSPSRHVRLFKREGAHFSEDIVHEKIIIPANAKITQLSSAIMHYSFRDVSHALYKLNRYSSYTAKSRLGKYNSSSLMKAIASSMWMFFRCYVLQRGFLDGKLGFLLAVINAEGSFYRRVKQIYQDVDN